MLAEPVFKMAEEMLRTNTGESLKHRNPIIKKELPGAWRILSTDERKLLATVGNGNGRVVLLERRNGKVEHKDSYSHNQNSNFKKRLARRSLNANRVVSM